jgi:site-specific DNA recombinase
MCSNLGGYWNNLDYQNKQNLQYLVFPEGIYFDKKTQGVRTEKVNSIFSAIGYVSKELERNKKGIDRSSFDLSPLVHPERFELPTVRTGI